MRRYALWGNAFYTKLSVNDVFVPNAALAGFDLFVALTVAGETDVGYAWRVAPRISPVGSGLHRRDRRPVHGIDRVLVIHLDEIRSEVLRNLKVISQGPTPTHPLREASGNRTRPRRCSRSTPPGSAMRRVS